MAPSTTLGLEQELRELSGRIADIDRDAAAKHEAAEKVVAEYREKGVNPLLDTDAFGIVDAAYKEADTLKDEANNLRERAQSVAERLGRTPEKEAKRREQRMEAAVDVLMATPEYRRLAETGSFTSAGARIELPGVEVASREAVIRAFKTGGSLFAATAVVGDMIDEDQRRFPPIAIPVRQVRIPDLITMSTTDSDLVKFVRETVRTDAAAETALGTAYSEADYEYTEDEAAVKDIGHFTPAHRSNLADRGQVQALLEGRLQNGVERRFESQIVSGDGTGQNLEGILHNSDVAAITRDTTNESRLDFLHRAITAVRLSLFDEPDAIGLHPSDYHDCVVEKASTAGTYQLGGAGIQDIRTIWGFPVAVTSVFPEGTGLVGNYREGAVAWVRSGVSVRASDSHSDFFTRRMVALLAEMRVAFAVWQTQAWCIAEAM